MDSGDDYLGTREVVLYLPPGASENPRPEYDLIYATDVGSEVAPAFARVLDQLFDHEETSDAALVGFGDFLVDPEHQDTNEDRDNLLTMARTPPPYTTLSLLLFPM